MRGVGRSLLDEVRQHEQSLGLAEVFETPKQAKSGNVFRIASADGLLYEMGLFGSWLRDIDRLVEFDRPPKPHLRLYQEPVHTLRRTMRVKMSEGVVQIDLDEMAVPYVELLLSEVLRVASVHNIRKLEEQVSLPRFLELFGGWTAEDVDGMMTRYFVQRMVQGMDLEPVTVQKTCAALAETEFDNMARALDLETGSEWEIEEMRNYVIESGGSDPWGAKVRTLVDGVGVCTYWNDETCVEFAGLVVKEKATDILKDRQTFHEFVEGARRRRDESKLSSFIEDHLYPDEPLS